MFDDATATDNCGEVSIDVVNETTAGACAGEYTITRTFTATDDATAAVTQTITVQDTTAPEFTSVPADYTAECSEELVLDEASASDNCGTVTLKLRAKQSPVTLRATTLWCARSRQRTTAATAAATQTITVQDTTAPELSIPADYTAECSDELVMDDATATDNCGEVSIEVSSETTAGDCAGNYTITRTFTATDDCGNSSSATQTITVQDTTAPELSIPADYTAECTDELTIDDATASDNCGTVSIDRRQIRWQAIVPLMGTSSSAHSLRRTTAATATARRKRSPWSTRRDPSCSFRRATRPIAATTWCCWMHWRATLGFGLGDSGGELRLHL